jgi:hypothetical protein
MKLFPKRAVAVAAAVIVGFGAMIAGGTAQAASADNYASSYAHGWYKNSFDVAFQIRQMFSGSINAYNEADAVSKNCDGCRSVAIAFQIVADGRAASEVNAGNDASAVNVNCGNCTTVGIAYQFVMDKPTVLTWSDMGKLYQIEYKLYALRWSHASADSISAQVESLAGNVSTILANAGSGGYWPLVHRYITWRH